MERPGRPCRLPHRLRSTPRATVPARRAEPPALGRARPVGVASLTAVTVAFWPAFRVSSGITEEIDQLPAGVVQAFGLANFGTPAGYLRGNLYELFVPLLLAAAAVAMATGQIAGEEASGRLELIFAQPLDRRVIFLGRAIAVLIALMIISGIVALVQLAVDAEADLAIDTGRILSTVALCALLAALHGSLAVAFAGIRRDRRSGSASGSASRLPDTSSPPCSR
jgi:ABC-2 type transport system permease protein